MMAMRGEEEPTVWQKRYNELLIQLCAPHHDASRWLREALEVWLLWDHIIDDDPIDKGRAEAALGSMLLRWPQNPFWCECAAKLGPTIGAVIHAWQMATHEGIGGRTKENDVYTELPYAVAHCLGMTEERLALLAEIRRVTAEMVAEDDVRDEPKGGE